MQCLLVLTALVSTPSLTLLTLLMHNSLLSPSNLLHLPLDNLPNLPNLLSDNPFINPADSSHAQLF